MADTSRDERRTRRHDATRREILDAAWRLARERGLTGWTLRQVAGAVGMRAPSLYGYFASKDAIYDAMFAEGYEELLARIAEVDVDEGDVDAEPVQLLRRAARVMLDFCAEDPARFQLLFLRVIPGFEPSEASYALAEGLLERLRRVMADAGISDPAAVDLWTAMVTGLATQQLSNEPGGDRWIRLLDRALDRFLAAELPAG
jgi:AcrR family transcriptional regulator